ncbi:MAG: hypothetical protein IPO77_16955 [Acidobacteria bacterium]|nr:hypothetical protein [Acidobacteriota bacterium]
MKMLLTVIILFLYYPIHGLHQKNVLTESEIVRLAEDFVKEQGYTNEPPISDKSKWSPDSVWGAPDEEEMAERRNLILSGAYGVVNKSSGTIPWDWVVVFRYNLQHPYSQRIKEWKKMTKNSGIAISVG